MPIILGNGIYLTVNINMFLNHSVYYRKDLALAFLLLFLALLLIRFTSPRLRIEGYSGLLLKQICLGTVTKFSKDYSDEGFLQIKIGMTKKEVIEILGEPINEWQPLDPTQQSLTYSEAGRSGDYSLRQILLEKGQVHEIFGYFFTD